MNLKNRIVALVTAASVAVPAIAVAKYSMMPNGTFKPEAHVSGKLTGGVSVEGKSYHVRLVDDDKTLKVNIKLDGLDTGIGGRNKHMKKSLFMDKWFDADLTVDKSKIKGKPNGTVGGNLAMGGKSVPVTVTYTSKEVEGGRTEVVGKSRINYREFFGWEGKFREEEIEVKGEKKKVMRGEPACNVGICLKDDLEVTVKLYVSKDQ